MKRIVLVALTVGALVLGGCSAAKEGSGSNEAPAAAPQRPGGAAGDAVTEGGQAKPPQESVTSTAGPVDGRALIYRGDIVVRVDDVEAVAARVEALAKGLQGHIASQKRTSGQQNASASITMRVPATSFEMAMNQVGLMGKEQSRSSNTEDVTEAVVDLDTRIAAQRASVDAVRRMYDRATALNDLVLLEKELSQRQAELAVLEAKKRRLDDLVALSTINVSLAGPNTEIPVEKKRSPGFLGGLQAGWDAFVATFNVLMVVLGYVLPFAIAIAIPIVFFVWLSRRRRRPVAAPAQVEPPREG